MGVSICMRAYVFICLYVCISAYILCIDIYFSITWHIIGAAHNICVYGPVYVCLYVCVCIYVCICMSIYV